MEIKIGTRKSKLAMWQAEYIKDLLSKNNITAKLFPMETKGDKILDKSIAKIGSKGVFTEELEAKLLSLEIDIAVHSAKDLQSDLGKDFEIIAFTEREEAHDVIISRKPLNPEDKSSSFVLGTSSVRRTSLIKHYFPHVKLADMRGNLQTRIEKMDNNHCDGLVLAKAGVLRMGYEDMIVYEFDPDFFIPPVGQGCLAVEASKNLPADIKKILRQILNSDKTETILRAERKFLNILEGGCSIPAFCHGRIENNKILLKGGVVSTDGKVIVFKEVESDSPENAGQILALSVLENGGRDILKNLKH
ncbi:MAG: hydroxymethylbilane synthase [Desulfobacteraceae bacterium]|nr:hydroxymethylbilane synthase [Desulfobacteraceae bacterium]